MTWFLEATCLWTDTTYHDFLFTQTLRQEYGVPVNEDVDSNVREAESNPFYIALAYIRCNILWDEFTLVSAL